MSTIPRRLQAWKPGPAQWLPGHVPTNAVVASRKPDHVWLVSSRRGFRYDEPAPGEAAKDVWSHIIAQRGDGPLLILQDAFPAGTGYGNARVHGLDPAVAEHRDQLDLLYETASPVTRVWSVRAGPPPAAP